MILTQQFSIDGQEACGVEVKLPLTTLLSISTARGYIMCGALDIGLLNTRLADRKIIAARAVGVRTLEELYNSPLESVTTEAASLGVHPGMLGRDALKLML